MLPAKKPICYALWYNLTAFDSPNCVDVDAFEAEHHKNNAKGRCSVGQPFLVG